MDDPTRWLLSDVPERPAYYCSAEFDEEFEDDMHRADELSRANYDEETNDGEF